MLLFSVIYIQLDPVFNVKMYVMKLLHVSLCISMYIGYLLYNTEALYIMNTTTYPGMRTQTDYPEMRTLGEGLYPNVSIKTNVYNVSK